MRAEEKRNRDRAEVRREAEEADRESWQTQVHCTGSSWQKPSIWDSKYQDTVTSFLSPVFSCYVSQFCPVSVPVKRRTKTHKDTDNSLVTVDAYIQQTI
jgi:hypothetical protein